MSEVAEITNQKIWNSFITQHGPKSGAFLHSWEWGEFQQNFGKKIWRLGLTDNNELRAAALLIKHGIKFGKNYLYCPRGPVSNDELGIKNYELLIKKILEIAKKEKNVFIRLEPPTKFQVSSFKFQEATPVQPKHTLVLDLAKPEEELLAAMHEKTRYNIRLAQKKNLILKNGSPEDFWKLMEETTGRDKFRAHPQKYYETMLERISGNGKDEMRVELKIAYLGDMPLAAAIVGYFGDAVTYLHGASSHEHRNLMAPYFLHWEIIREAKKFGYKFYDFWGIDEAKWPGVTRFKKGFGGFEINYPGTFDLPTDKFWYNLYNLAKKFI